MTSAEYVPCLHLVQVNLNSYTALTAKNSVNWPTTARPKTEGASPSTVKIPFAILIHKHSDFIRLAWLHMGTYLRCTIKYTTLYQREQNPERQVLVNTAT